MSDMSSSLREASIASIDAMRRLEEGAYQVTSNVQLQSPNRGPLSPSISSVLQNIAMCRSKMAQWSHQIVDFCSLHRETAAIAMDYLDRYLSTASGQSALECNKEYQLTSMTCLYMAVKLHETQVMDPKLMVNLSKGLYSEQEVTNKELDILAALQWRVNPPTAKSFLRQFMQVIPSKAFSSRQSRSAVFEVASFQTELAVCDYDYVEVPNSTIAFACLINAMQQELSSDISEGLNAISKVAHIDRNCVILNQVRDGLFGFGFEMKNETMAMLDATSARPKMGIMQHAHLSPRSVARGERQ